MGWVLKRRVAFWAARKSAAGLGMERGSMPRPKRREVLAKDQKSLERARED
jgi:hypothetical protein